MTPHRQIQRFAAIVLAATVVCFSACSKSSNSVPVKSPKTDSEASQNTEPSRGQPALLPYEIMKREEVSSNKLVYRLRLDFIDGNHLPTEDDLAALSRHIRDSNPGFESVFVYFYMRGYDSEHHQPYGGAHHILDGKMEVDIHTQPVPPSVESTKFGLTEMQRKRLYQELIALDRESLDWENDDRLGSERLRVFKKYGIQKDLYWEIANEGSERGWATPRP